MTICPIAIAVGCKNCLAFTMCPLKGAIGDYKAPDKAATTKPPEAKSEDKREGKA